MADSLVLRAEATTAKVEDGRTCGFCGAKIENSNGSLAHTRGFLSIPSIGG